MFELNNFTVPPPLPKAQLPFLAVTQTTNGNSRKENLPPKIGYATEMLEKSVQNLKYNDKDDFKVNAGKIISLMVETRLNNDNLTKDGDITIATTAIPNNKTVVTNQMTSVTIPLKQTIMNNGPISESHFGSETIVSDKNTIDQTENVNDIVHSLDSTNPVKLRKKKNGNVNNELTTHVRDPRSLNEKLQSTNNNRISNSHTFDIADELKNGKHPVCCVCSTSISR